MIELKSIQKIYGTGSTKFCALNNVSLSVNDGEFVSIVGKSGCGKSTLLNILGCIDNFDSGEYVFDNINVKELKGRKLALFRGRKIGYVFQKFHLIPELNLAENVGVSLGYAGINAKIRNQISMDLLEKVGLQEKYRRKPSQISGGEQQRVAIARAIAANPKVILANEPTGNLDESNSQEVLRLLLECNKNGTTVIMVTHDMQLAKRADRMILLSDGKIVANE